MFHSNRNFVYIKYTECPFRFEGISSTPTYLCLYLDSKCLSINKYPDWKANETQIQKALVMADKLYTLLY